MWENAAPTPPPQHGSPSSGRRRRVSQSDGDYVIWGQLLLSLAFLALVLLAQMMDLPFLPALRTAFREAMMPEQNTFLSENRELSKFTRTGCTGPLQTPCRSLCRHRAKPPHRKPLYARPMQKRNRFLPARGKKVICRLLLSVSHWRVVPVPKPPGMAGVPIHGWFRVGLSPGK